MIIPIPSAKLWQVLLLAIVIVISPLTTLAQSESDTANKAQVITFLDAAYNQGDVSAIETLFAEDFAYNPGGLDKNFLLTSILGLRGALPDMQATPMIVLSDSNWVAVHMSIQGTFTSDLIIPKSVPIPPTNEPLQFIINMIFHFNEQGQVYEQWVTFDNLSYLSQLHVLEIEASTWQAPMTPVNLAPVSNIENQEASIHAYYDAINNKALSSLDQILDSSFVGYNPFGSFDKSGQIGDLTSLTGAFPDLELTITQIISEGDYVAVLYNMQGTFTQNFVVGEGGFPPTNRTLDLIRVDFFHVNEGGKIIESREIYDSLDFMVQMGLLPEELQEP